MGAAGYRVAESAAVSCSPSMCGYGFIRSDGNDFVNKCDFRVQRARRSGFVQNLNASFQFAVPHLKKVRIRT